MFKHEIDPQSKYIKTLKNKHPRLFQMVFYLEEMNYLNPIDRAFYCIRVREKFYKAYRDIIGEEFYHENEKSFKYEYKAEDCSKAQYSWSEFINGIDDYLVTEISDNLSKIKTDYHLNDLEWSLTKPDTIILNKPNLLAISPFLFSKTDWVKIIENDISKAYGKPLKKNHNNKKFNHIEGSVYNKRELHSLPQEIKKRTGTELIKNYKQKCGFIYVRTDEIGLVRIIIGIKFQKNIGVDNLQINTKESLIEAKKRRVRKLLTFHYNIKKLNTIFFIWLKLNKNEDNEKRELIKVFTAFFHVSTNKVEHMETPNLNVFNDRVYELISILKYFKDWSGSQKTDSNSKTERKSSTPIVQFKVYDLFQLLKLLQLDLYTNSFQTFRDEYYKKTESPKLVVEKIDYHLHL
ncbi:hypothetical protein [uncultured Christiangramia sp.]|uniref:hypothetical protein n=1 Tax=uncultured Christiangramia sp. TaxID=503836 RepID=UPI002612C56A|nr:hypothetical protein [uncultured Christiangramia sp.]